MAQATAEINQDVLVGLVARDQIRTVLFQYARGIDRRDDALVRSCYHGDAREEHGTFSGQASEFVDFVMPRLRRFGVTSHCLCNMWIEVNGEVAAAETYFIAFHLLPLADDASPSDLLLAGRYIDRFEKRDGNWKIAHRQLVYDYMRLADPSEAWDGPLGFARMKRPEAAPHDYVYRRWQEVTAAQEGTLPR